mmetsp:Transcript_157751/g.505949  ORF Transcript_157751/g.505949 Transcript_157751/m.505949 type:complete len:278 (+) Transcript_157751:718-1551(+)
MSCPLSATAGWLANRLAMLREECLATFLHIVEVPEDCRQPTLVPKVAADPDVPLVVVQFQLSPVHVAVVVLPLAVAEQLHRLVVARRHPREVGDSQVQLRDQRRKTVAQPSLLGVAELRVLLAGLKIPALHPALRGVEALLLAEAHDLLCLLHGEELSHLEHLRPEGQRPQQRGAPAHVPELLLEADAHRRPHPDSELKEKGHRSCLQGLHVLQAPALRVEDGPRRLQRLQRREAEARSDGLGGLLDAGPGRRPRQVPDEAPLWSSKWQLAAVVGAK